MKLGCVLSTSLLSNGKGGIVGSWMTGYAEAIPRRTLDRFSGFLASET
jgi:hypothetical protein